MDERRIEVALWPLVANRNIPAPNGIRTTINEAESPDNYEERRILGYGAT
jgi:hypothetical protein